MNRADRREIIDAADAARWAYAQNRPETGDRHIERIKALAASPEPARRSILTGGIADGSDVGLRFPTGTTLLPRGDRD